MAAKVREKILVAGIIVFTSLIVLSASFAIPLTITKQVRNATLATGFAASATALPGQTLEYAITIFNVNQFPGNPAKDQTQGIYVSDPLDANTTFVAGSLTFVAASSTAGTTAVQSASTALPILVVNVGQGATAALPGLMKQGWTVVFTYQVTVK